VVLKIAQKIIQKKLSIMISLDFKNSVLVSKRNQEVVQQEKCAHMFRKRQKNLWVKAVQH
jgi:hypothetical protein